MWRFRETDERPAIYIESDRRAEYARVILDTKALVADSLGECDAIIWDRSVTERQWSILEEHRKPVLLINEAMLSAVELCGGSVGPVKSNGIIQHAPHRDDDEPTLHAIVPTIGSIVDMHLTAGERVESHHTLAVRRYSHQFVPTSFSEDSTIESIEWFTDPEWWCVGVQFELLNPLTSRLVYGLFGAVMESRVTRSVELDSASV